MQKCFPKGLGLILLNDSMADAGQFPFSATFPEQQNPPAPQTAGQ